MEPGTANTSRPCSAARLAVIIAPEVCEALHQQHAAAQAADDAVAGGEGALRRAACPARIRIRWRRPFRGCARPVPRSPGDRMMSAPLPSTAMVAPPPSRAASWAQCVHAARQPADHTDVLARQRRGEFPGGAIAVGAWRVASRRWQTCARTQAGLRRARTASPAGRGSRSAPPGSPRRCASPRACRKRSMAAKRRKKASSVRAARRLLSAFAPRKRMRRLVRPRCPTRRARRRTGSVRR